MGIIADFLTLLTYPIPDLTQIKTKSIVLTNPEKMKKLHNYVVSEANIASIYDKLKKLLEGANTRIDEITNLRLVNEVRFLKKSDLKSTCIKIDWVVENTTKTILVTALDKVEFLGTRSVCIKHKTEGILRTTLFYVVQKLPEENPETL